MGIQYKNTGHSILDGGLFRKIRYGIEIFKSEQIVLSLYGSEAAEQAYQRFSKPHRLLPFFSAKEFGAALFRLPQSSSEYLVGKQFEYARRKRRKAINSGFFFEPFAATERIDQILQINRSAPERQHRAVPESYIDEVQVGEFCKNAQTLYGVFNQDGDLVAYSYAPVLGDIFVYSRILGHADYLDLGTMYLLVSGVTYHMIENRQTRGNPGWAMYDMFWGASPGLRFFKERLGFRPYRVHWKLRNQED